MPGLGLFPQAVAILFQRPVGIEELRELLGEFSIVREDAAAQGWEISGPALIVDFLPEAKGLISVDTVDQPWPDSMGGKDQPGLLAAWSMGWFGPWTFPGNLERAVQQAQWRWPEAPEVVRRHQAFVRIRVSYTMFNRPFDAQAKCFPKNRDALYELEFITAMASRLLQHPEALCYFNPNGEVVMAQAMLDQHAALAREHQRPPVDVWSNVRLFDLNPEWSLMDTVGNGQMDRLDLEAAFPKGRFSPEEIDPWLRNLTLYLLNPAKPLKDGDSIDGPGAVPWQVFHSENSMGGPPRKVWRWLPYGVDGIPPELFANLEREKPKPEEQKPLPPPIPAAEARWGDSAPEHLRELRALYSKQGKAYLSKEKRIRDPEGDAIPNRKLVFSSGTVVWGFFVRAFWPCYMAGRYSHYGTVIVSFDPALEDPKTLFEVGARLRNLRKPVQVPPSLKDFVTALRDDYKGVPRLKIPGELTGGREIYFQSILALRNRLPTGILHHRLVPVLAHPESEYCTLVPHLCWPGEFKATWLKGDAPLSAKELAGYQARFPSVKP
jgi:hypothetical protein